MVEKIRLYGKDLGVLIGPRNDSNFSQILIYQPVNDLIPCKEMSTEEIVKCLPLTNSDKQIDIFNDFLNRIEINSGIPIWRNPESFGMNSFNKNSYDGSYFGRGKLAIYFKNNSFRAYEFADYLIKKDIGLRFF